MPTFTNQDKTSRYKSHNDIIENPTPGDDLEEAYQKMEVAEAVQKLQAKYGSTPRFLKEIALELARLELLKQEKARQI